jgi:hypothetical protein
MRKQARLTLDEAAVRLDLKRSALRRVEAGDARVSVRLVRRMMDLYDQHSPDLVDTARAARGRGWWDDLRVADPDYVAWEAGATRISEFAAVRIPELLQTEDYTRALLADAQDVDAELTACRIRQARLMGEDRSLAVSVVVDEAALWNLVGDPMVMYAQRDHLLGCSKWAGLTLRVLPAAAGTRMRTGGFRLLGFDHPEDAPVVFQDSMFGVFREEGAKHVADVRRVFDLITGAALSVDESYEFIEQFVR